MSIGKGFGERLGLLRRERALQLGRDVPQAEVAKALKIPATTYSRLESGVFKRSPELATLKALAKYYDVTLGWLWFGEGDRAGGPPANVPRNPIIKETESERDITAAHQPTTSKRAAGSGRGHRSK